MSEDRSRRAGSDHPLLRSGTVRLVWIAGLVALILSVVADRFVEHHPYFDIDGVFAFGAWFGLLAGGLLVLVAKLVSLLLQRPDTYYDD